MDKNTSAANTVVDSHSDETRSKEQDVENGKQSGAEIPAGVALVDDVDEKAGSQEELEFPDGGWRAWSVCFGVCSASGVYSVLTQVSQGACVTISTFGYVNSWGVSILNDLTSHKITHFRRSKRTMKPSSFQTIHLRQCKSDSPRNHDSDSSQLMDWFHTILPNLRPWPPRRSSH